MSYLIWSFVILVNFPGMLEGKNVSVATVFFVAGIMAYAITMDVMVWRNKK